jgi:hypothetical protein
MFRWRQTLHGQPLETGIYVAKHNYDLATRNRDMCHQTQLWFSH